MSQQLLLEPVERVFEAFPEQQEFLDANESEVLYAGAFGAGKSRVGCEKGLFLSQYYPRNVGLICRRYFGDLASTTLQTLFEKVIPPDHIVRHHRSEHYVDVVDQAGTSSRIWYRGLDRPTGIGSMELGWVFCDEIVELEPDQYAMLEGRLRLSTVPFRQIFGATNPDAPSHWLHRRFFDERPLDANGRPVRRVIEANAYSNPHNPPDFRARLDRLQGIHRERFALGKWVGSEGLVFPDFNPLTHVCDAKEALPGGKVPLEWPRWRSIDFGTTNPFVCQWWTRDPVDGTYIRYREIYMSGRRAALHAEDIQRVSGSETYQATPADHDHGDRLELEAHGITTVLAKKSKGDKQRGIQLQAQLLAPRALLVSDRWPKGKPGVLFIRDALEETDPRLEMERRPTCTEEEPGAYKWAGGAHDTHKDEPLDKDNHGMDAWRYFILHVETSAPPARTVRKGTKAPRVAPGEFYSGDTRP